MSWIYWPNIWRVSTRLLVIECGPRDTLDRTYVIELWLDFWLIWLYIFLVLFNQINFSQCRYESSFSIQTPQHANLKWITKIMLIIYHSVWLHFSKFDYLIQTFEWQKQKEDFINYIYPYCWRFSCSSNEIKDFVCKNLFSLILFNRFIYWEKKIFF